jgi:hypothetical protein
METLTYAKGTLTLDADRSRVIAYVTDRAAAVEVATVTKATSNGDSFLVSHGHELQRLIAPLGGTADDVLPLQNAIRRMIALQPRK